MGEHANDSLDMIACNEAIADLYVEGGLSDQDAYDCGFVDELGVEQEGIQAAWDRAELGGLDHITEQLRVEELKFDYRQLEQQVAERVTHSVILRMHQFSPVHKSYQHGNNTENSDSSFHSHVECRY